uniref:Venom protein n=1 Tax=Heterorhabditis bacteriophora TaxID=37862 RepID=A0A1I7XPA5_HETBA
MFRMTLLIFLIGALIGVAHCGCYRNWSRCTPQTMLGTGILWKSCPDYCRQCQGRESGSCVKVKGGACSGGYQCQCFGGRRAKSTDAIVSRTCKLGL